MFNRIKVLTLLQLSTTSKLYSKKSNRIYAHIAIRTILVILISIMMSLLMKFIKDFLQIPINEYFMIFILVITQGLSILVSTIGLMNNMYHSKDNSILFSLPVNGTEIYISKLVVYYINEFIRNLYLVVPLLISFGFVLDVNFIYFIRMIPIIFALPIISVGMASLLAIPLTYIKNFLRRHEWLSFVLTIIAFTLFFMLLMFMVSKIPLPIRIVQMFNQFIISLTLFMQKVAAYSSIYTSIGKYLYGVNTILNVLIILASIAFLALLNYLLSIPIYFHLMSVSGEHTAKKDVKAKSLSSDSLFITFFKKELTIAKRSPVELLNGYTLLIALPIILYVLNYIYTGMNLSSVGNSLVLIFNVMITLLVIAGSNILSATAFSKEGYEFVLLKTAPYNTSRIAWAKLAFNMIVSSFILLISFIIFSITLKNFNKTDIVLLYVFINFINMSHMLWSLQEDVVNPKLSDYAETGSIEGNINVKKSVSNGLKITIVFTILSVISFFFLKDISWFIMIITAVLFFIYRLISFKRHLNAYFVDIEY